MENRLGRGTIVTSRDDGAPLVAERVLAEPTSDQQLLTQIVLALGRGAALPSGVTAVTMTAANRAACALGAAISRFWSQVNHLTRAMAAEKASDQFFRADYGGSAALVSAKESITGRDTVSPNLPAEDDRVQLVR